MGGRDSSERMAATLNEKVGETIGVRVRFGSKVSRRTRVEVVTEGVFTRLVLDDPSLAKLVAILPTSQPPVVQGSWNEIGKQHS